jgi:site-specific recombinase XerD
MTALAPSLQAFFTERLIAQRRASGHTVVAYRDTFRLLLGFAQAQTHKNPSRLEIEDLDAELIAKFLEYLEIERSNSIRTRNARLAAIHSFFNYIALRHPGSWSKSQRWMIDVLRPSVPWRSRRGGDAPLVHDER